MKISICILFILLWASILWGCAPADDSFDSTKVISADSVYLGRIGSSIDVDIFRYVDNEASIVCYITIGSYKGGIFCVPINETTLCK